MSLINQALKMEQRRRQTEAAGPVNPMVNRAIRRGNESKTPMLLFGFTAMGMLFAAAISCVLYFGNQYIDGANHSVASGNVATASADQPAPETAPASDLAQTAEGASEIDSLMETLSDEQLSTVRSMLLEREAEEALSGEAVASAAEQAGATPLSEIARNQEIVDGFSIQGIRKSGKDTRVFLNGKIQKLGDIIDIESGISLLGYTDDALVFEDRAGNRYQRTL